MQAPSAQESNEADALKTHFSSDRGINIRPGPCSSLLCETQGCLHGQQGPCCLLSIFVCSLHSWKKRMAFCLKRYLMDIYAAVRLWREPLISFSSYTHTRTHTLPQFLWSPKNAIIGPLCVWTHTHRRTHAHCKPECSAVQPHQWTRPRNLTPVTSGEMAQRSRFKINPARWVNRMCTLSRTCGTHSSEDARAGRERSNRLKHTVAVQKPPLRVVWMDPLIEQRLIHANAS